MNKRNKKNNLKNEKKEIKYDIKNNKKVNWKKIILISFIVLFLILLIVAGIGVGIVFGIMNDASLSSEELSINYENSEIYDLDGNLIVSLSGDENREIISITDMSAYLPAAFVAIEDERFYQHPGIDVKRTIAATVTYILNGGESSFGGSTITQQLVKNLTSEDDRTWQRKVKEIARAYKVEKEISKDQVLELYLNLIFLGGNTYGVEVASNYYFNKSASELDLAEAAFIAGINHSPNGYSPFSEEESDKEKIKKRVIIVLEKMKELGTIGEFVLNEEEYNNAISKVKSNQLVFTKGKITETIYSYHTDAAIMQVINELQEKNSWDYKYARLYVYSKGLKIYTTQNTSIQKIMEEEFLDTKSYQKTSNKQKDTDGNYAKSQSAMVLIDHKTGYVLATCGGLGEKTALGQNRATQSVRQTGSSLKPLIAVASGLENGVFTASKVVDDVPTSFGGYKPRNSNYYKGLCNIRSFICTSQNVPAVKLLAEVGVEKGVKFLKDLGISSLVETDNSLTIALGGLTYGISPLEMAAAYATVANDGQYIEPTFYTKVLDSKNNVVIQKEQETRRVLSEGNAYIIKSIMREPVLSGTATNCGISGMDVAAKTGTTDKDFDRWLCGFTPYYTAATWYGYDIGEKMNSGNIASKIWDAVITKVHKDLKGQRFSKPSTITTALVCKDSGLLATEDCKNDPRGSRAYTEFFVKGTVPTKTCECHVKVKVCKETGVLATEFCQNFEEKIYITRTDADTNTAWETAKDAEYMLPKETCTIHTSAPVVDLPKVEEPVINSPQNETVTPPVVNPPQTENVTPPVVNPPQNETVTPPVVNPPQTENVTPPVENIQQNETVTPPSENTPQNETATSSN